VSSDGSAGCPPSAGSARPSPRGDARELPDMSESGTADPACVYPRVGAIGAPFLRGTHT
jgi:hypothetical protein